MDKRFARDTVEEALQETFANNEAFAGSLVALMHRLSHEGEIELCEQVYTFLQMYQPVYNEWTLLYEALLREVRARSSSGGNGRPV